MSTRRSLVFARLYYFAYFGAIGCFVPFINLYFEQIGLAGTAIGVLAALPPGLRLLAGPAWGGVGDRFRIHRWLLPLATLGVVAPTLLILKVEHYAWLAVLVALAAVFDAPLIPLSDSAVLDLVSGTSASYGSIRVWGSLGFTLATWGMGLVLRAWGLAWLFYGYAALLGLAALMALGLPARRQALQQSYSAGLRSLLAQRPLALFLVGSFLVGATLQASYSFYPLHLAASGGDAAWVGLATGLAAVTEMPVLFFSARLFRRLGVRGAVLLGFGAFALRWALVALARDPVLIVLTASLHGLSFGAALVGSIAFVERYTPPGLHATAQGMLTAVHFGLGAATGALGGGWLYDLVGAPGLFGIAAGMALLATGFVLAAGPLRRVRLQEAEHPRMG